MKKSVGRRKRLPHKGASPCDLSKRRSRGWVEMHFANPQKLVPGSVMPAYKLPPPDLENLTSYLFSLPEQ